LNGEFQAYHGSVYNQLLEDPLVASIEDENTKLATFREIALVWQ